MTTQDEQDKLARSVLLGTLFLFLGGLFVAFAGIGLRYAVQDGLGAQTTGLWRFLLSLPLLAVVFMFMRRLPRKPNLFAILTGIFFGMDIGFWHMSLTMTSVANATFIVNLGSISVGFLAWIFLKERPSVFWGVAVVMAVIGAWMLSRGGQMDAGSGGLRGDLLACVAAGFISFYFLNARIARRSLPAIDVIFWMTLSMTVVATGFCLVFGEPLVPDSLPDLKWPFLIALIAHVLGQGLIILGIGRAPANVAGIMVIVQPVASAIASWPLFGEALAGLQLAGAGLILAALLTSQFSALRLRAAGRRPTKLSQ